MSEKDFILCCISFICASVGLLLRGIQNDFPIGMTGTMWQHRVN